MLAQSHNEQEFEEIVARGLAASMNSEVLIEESLLGWKEFELEVMRDRKDNAVIVCSIENVDPMGVHTGDSITVAPAQTLTDREYQRMRDASLAVMRAIGVETGGSNVQWALNPENGRMIIIEMNPRVSRSSALASKATGFPIAKFAAKLAVGYTLDEIMNDIPRAIEYYYAITRALEERHSPYKAIIAFSGDKEYNGKVQNEASINGFPSNAIEKTFKKEPYRFLVVANKFQTGYDEPLLHTMYVDKVLTDIKAVQTLSRLNRACPLKRDTFVLDFAENEEAVKEAFSKFYRTTILADETDPNKLFDLISTLEHHQVYSAEEVEHLVELYINNAERDKLDPILDLCVARYEEELDEDGQIEFKSAAKAFIRTYGFLGSILPYGNADWEKLSIFLQLLLPKLPSPDDPDLAKGILEAVDLESYRVEAQTTIAIQLNDDNAEIDPVPAGYAGGKQEPELDPLTSILQTFNETFGNIAPGDIRYANVSDRNNNNTVDRDDRTVIGNVIPRYTYGLNIAMQYKGFDLSMLIQGVGKVNAIYTGDAVWALYNAGKMQTWHTDYWTPQNPGASYPRLIADSSHNNFQNSSFWVYDASYVRLKNMQLGYTLPERLTRKIWIQKLRFYVSGDNLLTFDHMPKGWDPETRSGDAEIYPIASTYAFGVQITF